ncbi:MAG: D-alanyl-D-alanine carboxypeptidase, partial [Thermoplasmata archaeon]
MLTGIYFPEKGIDVNSEKYFIPASNTKIFTSYYALKVLGNDHEFSSCYAIKNKKLYIKTFGNPLITQHDLLEMMDHIEEKVEEVILYCKYLHPTERPPGWCIDDIHEPYAPPVSEINYELNRIRINANGIFPENDFFSIVEHRGKNHIENNKIFFNNKEFTFSPDNPENIFEHSLSFLLKKKKVAGKNLRIYNRNFHVSCESFARHNISEILKIMNKESENSIAESLILYTGMRKNQTGLKRSLRYMKKLLNEDGISGFVFYDGSGLSHYNIVTPRSIVSVLYKLIDNKIFKDSLPVGGVDGTLKNRLDSRIRAKTGTLNHVQNLSGYFEDHPFSITVNNAANVKKARN